MQDAYQRPAPDGRITVDAPHAAAALGRWAVVARDKNAVPAWDADRGLLFVGDVRLYNRQEIIADLGLSSVSLRDSSDLELARQAYLVWGEAAPTHLVGDFAFVAWEDKRRRLFVARDHFGVRPLCYWLSADLVAIASDVRQLLTLFDHPVDDVDAQAVLEWLLGRRNNNRGTFFRGVARVPPGHSVVFENGVARESRYWVPPGPPSLARSYEENCEELRTIFRRAVRDRLESDCPIVAHSSGGFDSSTIVMAADEAYRAGVARAPLTLASAIAPGFPSDESHYMDAVAANVSFEGVRWSAIWDDTISFPGVSRAAPKLLRGPGGGPRGDLEIARARGARVLLSGVLGDGLWYAAAVRRDMVRHGRLIGAMRDLVARQPLGSRLLRDTLDAVLGVLPPTRAASLAASRLLARTTPRPEWLGPELRGIFTSRDRPKILDGTWSSHLQHAMWTRLCGRDASQAIDSFVDYAAEEGVELRAPFADVRLTECLFNIPWWQRQPRGHLRRTGRDALGPFLPAEFSSRTAQRPWTEVWTANLRRVASVLAPMFRHGAWLSAPFVDRSIARAMLEDVLAGRESADLRLHILVSEIGTLEAWLRSLFE